MKTTFSLVAMSHSSPVQKANALTRMTKIQVICSQKLNI